MKHKVMTKKIVLFIYISVMLFLLNANSLHAMGESTANGFQQAILDLFNEYKFVLSIVIGFGLMTSILAFVINFVKLGANADNPHQRAFILKELIAIGITTALIGSVGTLYIYLYIIF